MHDLWTSRSIEPMRELLRLQWQTHLVRSGNTEVPANFRFEIYRDSIIGLNEIVRGLLEFFPHKRTVAFIQGTTPKISSFLAGLSRDGIVTKEIPLDLAQQDPAAAFQLCDDDTLMVIAGTRDPLTGQTFSLQTFQALLGPKKIFSVEVSPSLSAVDFSIPSSPYRAQLVSLRPGLAVCVMGSRAKGPPLLMGTPYFGSADESALAEEFSKLDLGASLPQEAAVDKFESQVPTGAHVFFTTETQRLKDRAVLVWDGFDGYAICELLCEKNKWDFNQTLGTGLDTASGCRWSEWNFNTWLNEQGLSAETQRGLVVFSAELVLTNPQLATQLNAIYAELRALQFEN